MGIYFTWFAAVQTNASHYSRHLLRPTSTLQVIMCRSTGRQQGNYSALLLHHYLSQKLWRHESFAYPFIWVFLNATRIESSPPSASTWLNYDEHKFRSPSYLHLCTPLQ